MFNANVFISSSFFIISVFSCSFSFFFITANCFKSSASLVKTSFLLLSVVILAAVCFSFAKAVNESLKTIFLLTLLYKVVISAFCVVIFSRLLSLALVVAKALVSVGASLASNLFALAKSCLFLLVFNSTIISSSDISCDNACLLVSLVSLLTCSFLTSIILFKESTIP